MVRIVASILASVSVCAALALNPAPVSAQSKSGAAAPKTVSTAVVNVNTASASEFEALPGVGPKLAARIVEYRQKNGPFKKVEDLMNVRGLGEKNFLKLKAQLTLGSAKAADRAQQ
jgi:competence protein ComEA